VTELRDRLTRDDPIASEPPLRPVDVKRMRQAVIAAAEESRPFHAGWQRTVWTIAAVLVVSAIVGIERRVERTQPVFSERPTTRIDADVAQTSSPRQLQFQTPGGTRVIWIFNPDFQP
jgi:hypothetical protein